MDLFSYNITSSTFTFLISPTNIITLSFLNYCFQTTVGSSQKLLDIPESTLTSNLSQAGANNKLTLASKDNTIVNNVACVDPNAKKSAMGCESNNISTPQSSSLLVAVSPDLSPSSNSLQEVKSCKMRKQICARAQISPMIREDFSSQHEKVSGKLQNRFVELCFSFIVIEITFA